MVFGQLRIWNRPFFEQILLKNSQIWNACNDLLSLTTFLHQNKIKYWPSIEHQVSSNLPLHSNRSINLWKANKFLSLKKNKFVFTCKQSKTNEICISTKSYIQPLPQENEDDHYELNLPILKHVNQYNKHELFLGLKEKCTSLSTKNVFIFSNNANISCSQKTPFATSKFHTEECKGLENTKDFCHYSPNYKYGYTIRFRSSRLGSKSQLHKNLHQNNPNNSFSSLEGSDAQDRANEYEAQKKLAKELEEKAKRAKAIHDDHVQTMAQLEVLKIQVKKIHEEMQARKHESWTIKFGKMANSFVNFVTKIGPTIGSILSMSRQDWKTKTDGWKKIIKLELQHYWVGGKLLWADIKISNRLLYRVLSGKNLSRRERQQLKRTTADLFRLVPFAVILVVPFMEFTLPFILKIFPNMLPSTFVDKSKEEENVNTKLVARVQYAKFLKETVQDMAKELKKSPSGELRRTAGDLESFMNKVHTGGDITNKEIVAFAKLFHDELTLDNISRPRLVSMCKYMNIQPYGTDAYMRYSLRNKLVEIKRDDKEIEKEGIDSLSESELRSACRERGMLGIQSVDQMRVQLQDWLDLSIVQKIPSSLLILSRAFLVAGKTDAITAVEATLSSLPDEVISSVDVSTKASELELEERKKRLEILQQQEELIKKGK